MSEIRDKIIKACAERQAVYSEKRERALNKDDDGRWDEMQMGYEACTYILADVLRALGLQPAELDDDDRIKVPA